MVHNNDRWKIILQKQSNKEWFFNAIPVCLIHLRQWHSNFRLFVAMLHKTGGT